MNVVAHRGASVAEAENTPAAFSVADRMGADGVELDVRLVPDGHGGGRLVVHHDPLPVEPELIDALPSFDDVLEACGARMLINVEIKNQVDDGGFDPTMAMVEPTLAAMRRFDARPARWLISSFSPETVGHVRSLGCEFSTALLCYPLDESTIRLAAEGGHSAIHPSERFVTAEGVEAAHAAGLVVNTWTVNDEARIVELADAGVDGVCTDVPDVVRSALGRTSVSDSPSWHR